MSKVHDAQTQSCNQVSPLQCVSAYIERHVCVCVCVCVCVYKMLLSEYRLRRFTAV